MPTPPRPRRRPSTRRRPLFAAAIGLGAAWLAAGPAFARQDDAPPAAPADAAQSEEGPKTGPPLPPEIVPPPRKPATYTTVTPLLSEEERKALDDKIAQARYRDVLERGPGRDPNAAQVIRDWARLRTAELAVPELMENRAQLAEAADRFEREANRTVAGRSGGKEAEKIRQQTFPILAEELLKLKDKPPRAADPRGEDFGQLGSRPGRPRRRAGAAVGAGVEPAARDPPGDR